MKIKVAKISDIPELCALLESLFTQEAEFKSDRDAQIRGLTSVIENEAIGDILIVRENENIIGMVNVLYTVSTALGAVVQSVVTHLAEPGGQHMLKETVQKLHGLKTKNLRLICAALAVTNDYTLFTVTQYR